MNWSFKQEERIGFDGSFAVVAKAMTYKLLPRSCWRSWMWTSGCWGWFCQQYSERRRWGSRWTTTGIWRWDKDAQMEDAIEVLMHEGTDGPAGKVPRSTRYSIELANEFRFHYQESQRSYPWSREQWIHWTAKVHIHDYEVHTFKAEVFLRGQSLQQWCSDGSNQGMKQYSYNVRHSEEDEKRTWADNCAFYLANSRFRILQHSVLSHKVDSVQGDTGRETHWL